MWDTTERDECEVCTGPTLGLVKDRFQKHCFSAFWEWLLVKFKHIYTNFLFSSKVLLKSR